MSFGHNKFAVNNSSRVATPRAPHTSQSDRTFKSDCVIQTTKHKWYVKIRVPKLFQFVVDGKWDRVPYRAKSHPHEAYFVHAYAPNDTALHRMLFCKSGQDHDGSGNRSPNNENGSAISSSTPTTLFGSELSNEINHLRLTAIQALLDANPYAVATADHIGQTPLHLACQYAPISTQDVAELMLQYIPAVETAASMQDINGQTPLHCLVLGIINLESSIRNCINARNENNDLCCRRLVELIIKTYPTCMSIQDRHGKTALAYAKDDNDSISSQNQDKALLAAMLETHASFPLL